MAHAPRDRPGPLVGALRAAALGVAAGSRSTLGVTAPLLGSVRPLARAACLLAVAGEIVGDKLPVTPSRLDPPGPVVRVASGVAGGVLLVRRRGGGRAALVVAGVAGGLGAAAGTWGGAAWRRLAVGRGPDWPGAVAEDVAALSLAAWAVRR